MSKLETRIIFLDTSIFVQNNFLRGYKIKELANFSKEGFINLYLTSITYNEILSRIQKGLAKAKSEFRKADKIFEKECKVLKNAEEFDSYFPFVKINVEEEYQKLKEKLDSFLNENNFTIIDCEGVSIEKVFKNYFMNNPPFKEGDKKHEFPDAFVLEAIENWANKNSTKVLLISTDNDMLSFESDILIVKENISEILDTVNRNYKIEENQKKIDKVEKIFSENRGRIIDDIENDLQLALEEEFRWNNNYLHHEVDEVEVLSINGIVIGEYSITYLDDNQAIIEVLGTVDGSFEISFYDRSFASYDKEDDVWYGEEYKEEEGDDSIRFNAQIKIDYNPIAGEEFAEYSGLKEIRFIDSINI